MLMASCPCLSVLEWKFNIEFLLQSIIFLYFQGFTLYLFCQFKVYVWMHFLELILLGIFWNLCRLIPLTKLKRILSLMFSNSLSRTLISMVSLSPHAFCCFFKKHYWILNISPLFYVIMLDFCQFLLHKFPSCFYIFSLKH